MTSIWRKLQWEYLRNNITSVSFTVAYLAILFSLAAQRFLMYYEVNLALAVARACGQLLNATMGLVMLFVCRNTLTSLLNTRIGRYLPIDHYIYFHKLTGWIIVVASVAHTVGHLVNFWIVSEATTIEYFELLFSPSLGIGWFYGLASLTGWLLFLLLAIMCFFALNFFRRSGYFEVFFYSHRLYIPIIVITILHAPLFWRWLAPSFTIFVYELVTRFIRSRKEHHGSTYVIEGTLLPSRVIRLLICKPLNFKFNAGDFAYIMVPWITEREWHPITISSAPEDEHTLTLHIRAVGEWSNRLYNHFDHAQTMSIKDFIKNWKESTKIDMANFQPGTEFVEIDLNRTEEENAAFEEKRIEAMKNEFTSLAKRTMIVPMPPDCDEHGCARKNKKNSEDADIELPVMNLNNNNNNEEDKNSESTVPFLKALKTFVDGGSSKAVVLNEPLKIHLDGPFGAPSSNIFQTEHAVLISTGIGVTPFTSILQSIMYRYVEQTKCCPKCTYSWSEKILSRRVMNLRKVDFVWINRDHSSFEWFVEKLDHLMKQQLSVPGSNNEIIDRFLDVHLYVTGKQALTPSDILPGSGSEGFNWTLGRPKWNELFERIRRRNHGKVTVFYCGRPDLATNVRSLCNKFNFAFKKEVF